MEHNHDCPKRHEIRNSTSEFQIEGKEQGVEVYYKDKTAWRTQKAKGMLFDCSTGNVGLTFEEYLCKWGTCQGFGY